MAEKHSDGKKESSRKQDPVKTAGVEETSSVTTSTCIDKVANADTVNAAGTVSGGQGNTYFFNTYNTFNFTGKNEDGTEYTSPDTPGVTKRSSGVHPENIINDILKVEYPEKNGLNGSRDLQANGDVQTKGTVPVSKCLTETVDTHLDKNIVCTDLYEDHFGIQLRSPLSSEVRPESIQQYGSTHPSAQREIKRLDSSGEWELVSDTDCCIDTSTNGHVSSGTAGAEGNNFNMKVTDADKHGIISNILNSDNTDRLNAEVGDLLGVSRREIFNKSQGTLVVPHDDGQQVTLSDDQSLSNNGSSVADSCDGNVDLQGEQTLKNNGPSSLRMVEEESPMTQKERKSSVTSIGQGLGYYQTGYVVHDRIQHVIKNMLFILQKEPTHVMKVSEEVDRITRTLCHDSKGFGESAKVSVDNVEIAEELTEELFKIHQYDVRHEAKLMIKSVMVIGRSDADKLWDLSSFLRRIKFADGVRTKKYVHTISRSAAFSRSRPVLWNTFFSHLVKTTIYLLICTLSDSV